MTNTPTVTPDAYEYSGKLYLRVTSFLRAVGVSDFSKIPAKDREFYMERGRANHDLWQKVEEGVDHLYEFDPRVELYRPAHAKFLRETGFKALPGGIEKFVYATWRQLGVPVDEVNGFAGIAGTMDRIGTMQGRVVLPDYKTSEVPPSTAEQTAFYLLMTTYKFNEVDRYGVAFRNDGTYAMSQKYPYTDKDEVLRHLHKYAKEKSHVAH